MKKQCELCDKWHYEEDLNYLGYCAECAMSIIDSTDLNMLEEYCQDLGNESAIVSDRLIFYVQYLFGETNVCDILEGIARTMPKDKVQKAIKEFIMNDDDHFLEWERDHN